MENELLLCRGEIDFKLYSFYYMSEENIEYEEPEEEYCWKMIIINILKQKHIYISIKPSETSEEYENEIIQCKTRLSYLLLLLNNKIKFWNIIYEWNFRIQTIRKRKNKINNTKNIKSKYIGSMQRF